MRMRMRLALLGCVLLTISSRSLCHAQSNNVTSVTTSSTSSSSDVLVSMSRSVDTTTTTTNSTSNGCTFAGKLVFGMPTTLDQSGKYFTFGQIQTSTNQLVADFINQERCGIRLMSRGQYALELRYYDDRSSVSVTQRIGRKLIDNNNSGVDFIMAGYPSGLTEPLAEIVDSRHRMLMAGTAANPTIYANRPKTFGVNPSAKLSHESGLQAFANAGAKTVVTIMEDYSVLQTQCGAVPELAASLNMTLISSNLVAASPNISQLEPLARNIAKQNPDVVLTCFYDCVPWMQALRHAKWTPKGLSATICMGSETLHEGVATTDIPYLAGPSPWNPTVVSKDALTGWSSQEFADRFLTESSHDTVPYHAALFATALSILVQSMEATDSTNEDTLVNYMLNQTFRTTLGNVAFNPNGQNKISPPLVQYDTNGVIQTVYPPNVASAPLLYPMPTWEQRDCQHVSPCGQEGGECTRQGHCVCLPPQISVGSGATAACNDPEELNFLPSALVACGYALCVLALVASAVAGVWTWIHRRAWIVKASQPAVLGLILVGCAISTLSMIFMGFQTTYRQLDDGQENPEVARVDAACMAVPWLYGVGFVIAFSALLAKIERVRLINKAGKTKENTKIGLMRVGHIVLFMLTVEIAILAAWQIVSPYQWEREVLQEENGFPVESVGRCSSDQGPYFLLALIIFHIAALFYALLLCFQTRHIDDDFAESDNIAQTVAFMFQVLTLAVPIAVLVEDSNNIYYFVQICTVFLQNFTVLALMFVPKMIKNSTAQGNAFTLTRKDSIPMASITHCKWDEGVDVIHELIAEDSIGFTDEQRDKLVMVKSLLLNRHRKMSQKEEKLSYVPTNLLLKRSTANNFIMREFGGVMLDDNMSMSEYSTTLESTRSAFLFASDSAYFQDDGIYHVPPEFHLLPKEKKESVCDMLSFASLNHWGFNIFELLEVTDGHPLVFVGWAILGSPYSQMAMAKAAGRKTPDQFDLGGYKFPDEKGFNVPVRTLCDYLRVIEEDYENNPYHNAIHAADVLQSLHSLIQMTKDTLKPSKEELLSILLAAAVHDVKHPGRNNAFQSQALTGFSLTYNKTSILENLHASHAFRRMLNIDFTSDESGPNDVRKVSKHFNILCNLKKKQFHSVREKVIDAILHTDMSKHFEFVNKMKAMALARHQPGDSQSEASGPKDEEVWQILLFLLHMADISNSAKPDPIFSLWAERVMEEFFQQGDEESRLGMPISNLCNRATVNIPDSQFGFMNFVVQPSYDVLGQLLPEVQEAVLPIVSRNLDYWQLEKEKKHIRGASHKKEQAVEALNHEKSN
ncbi:affinity cAMP-specific and IBMX-insensitive 3',5'-cyclic phosphodiesterase [Seminavis robusta]|uniref:Phosphodiesterase n=1 Tax=Seminavis robusta TaxID=568900 RepID=A0A9N8HJF8_9STRA|nr:affinity cAMP-specific and IBMX-insensitive 3',5'-cyclic phosphodiesterase [Seminavis robusta]|eukprot:Sro857_g211710.1 affinity cAMP-specific and IBMX-insensitive 3',5'-cyclic phosphodiesterase (1313) ;mRNA; r:24585-28894